MSASVGDVRRILPKEIAEILNLGSEDRYNYGDEDGVSIRMGSLRALEALILSERDKARKEERDRLANMIDPEIGLPSDALLRRVHADVETRGRKNSNFAVTVHHRNIVVSAVASAIRQEPQGERFHTPSYRQWQSSPRLSPPL